jgi:putative tryptophan/tyrosine transport system ATP-binding protein
MLNVSSVSKTFFAGTVNERRALRDVDLNLAQGDFVTVIGSNGAGKSTVLNIVSGDLFPDEGTVTIDGRDVTKLQDHQRAAFVGRVFQDPMAGTAPHLTIEENMAIADRRGKSRRLATGVTRVKRRRFADELATLELGLENRLEDKGLTTLMVTHNMEQALRVGNRLIMMHEGRIILDLTEEEKRVRTVKDLLGEFEKIKGATIDDKTLLQ